MIPKIEPAENIPESISSITCMDSIIKNLKTIERHYVRNKENAKNQLNMLRDKIQNLETENLKSKSDFEQMKSKMKLLEEQNAKLKSDLEVSDSDKTLYHNQYIKNGRDVRELKAENESLKAKIKLFEERNSQSSEKLKSDLKTANISKSLSQSISRD